MQQKPESCCFCWTSASGALKLFDSFGMGTWDKLDDLFHNFSDKVRPRLKFENWAPKM